MEPRSIPFLDADSEPEAVQKACAGFTRTLAGFSTRWKALSVHALPLWVMRPFESLEAKDLPLLERIYVTGTLIRQVHQTVRTPPPLLPVIERSLALHTLHIEIRQNFDFDLVSLVWGRLKVLHITFADPMNGVVVLQSLSRLCPSLEECSLDFLVSIDTVTSSPSPVEWPHLRELEFRLSAPNGRSLYNFDIHKMLESITTPALTSLRVDIWGTGYHDAPIELDLPFHNLIVRSRCELESLVMLTDVGTTFSNTLHLLSSLTSLTLSMFADIPDYLTNPRTVFHYQMAMDALMALGEDLVCPRLTRLHFVACHPATASSFLDLVRTRVREQSVSLAIFKAAFTLSSEGDDQVLTSVLKEAKPEGLGVRFKWEFWMNRQHGSEKLILPEDGSEVRHYPAFAINSGQDSRTLS
ncbi:hypothetical protein V5O48_010919 [Marasmius crinis-equi]|uniref:F-box domain-containing protein n=1 Tax=Marasmius crinis-equi TaxID=585013 RepID=A0ABR3F711_9AGAR